MKTVKVVTPPNENKKKRTSFLTPYLPLFVKIFFAIGFLFISYLAFFQLGNAPMENWDEAWYADVTRNMLQTKEFVVLYWNKEVWLDKPPMYMWLSALVSSVIGLSELSVRVPSALSGIIVVMLVAWFAYRNYGFVPAFLAFMTLALNNVFVWRMRSGNIDLLATLFIFLVFLVQTSKLKYKYPILGFLFGCIYLTKASLVFFPLAIFILYELLFERKDILKRYKTYLGMAGIGLLLPVVWLLIGSLKVGPEFYQYFLFKADQGVASVSLAKVNLDYFWYTYYSLQRRFFFVLVIGVLFALRYIKDSKAFLMLLYGLALLIQLSFTDRSNNWYLLPAMPFWSLLIAYGAYHVLKVCKNNILIAALILVVTSVLSYRTFTINILPIFDSMANVNQMQSSKELNKLTGADEIIIRLDHLYPATVYYTERKVLSSPEDTKKKDATFIRREDVPIALKTKKIRWVVGKNSDIETLKSSAPDIKFNERKVNDEETILQVL